MQIILRTLLLAFLFMLPAPGAQAAPSECNAAREGVILYNVQHKLVQFCNGAQWIGLAAKIGGAGDTLSDLNCTSGQIVQWSGSNWTCANDGGGADNLGDHTATQNLAMAGFKVSNTSAVGLTTVAGAAPLGAPGGVDTLSGLSCSSDQIIKFNGTAWACAADDAGLPALSFASIWVGDASDEAAAVSMSGDATLTSTGVLTIADNAITTDKIDDGAVALADLAANAVDSSKIADGAIVTADIADNAVTPAKTDFVGTLTEGKWCTVSSGKIVCTSDAPTGGGGAATFQSFTSLGTATWNKPASGSIAYVECWGGGGSGARHATAAAKKGGGGGGGYSNGWFPLAALPASVTVTVGAGGAAVSSNTNGTVGGNSSFGTYLVGYGGGGGGISSSGGGGGGGLLSAGSTPTPGQPLILTAIYNDVFHYAGNGADCISNGWSGCNDYAPSEGVHHGGGGGSGGTAATLAGASSVYGGGGGGGRVSSTNGAGGTSLAGGAGGAGGTPGIDGQQPGGGGGGSSTTSGKGGDGQCNVTVF